ncbi:hypothetical protein [Hydrogenophilus thiooxidans]|uniref:hypothetical protein n=1 Tax=Hydrogenophilus thiooxidans TaxID=2820326 RepID=UPI001C242E3E|nr:hypothetical protein [Hydrogenophilus thiooxidans]
MGVALQLYEQLTDAGEDKARARLIAEAFEALESRYPHLPDLVTTRQLSEAELRLLKEIELVRGEIKAVELKLTKEIEDVRGEIKAVELKLTKEIEAVRLETTALRGEIEKSRANVLQWSFVFWLTQFAAIAALVWKVWS